jgi:hypothetical protein
MGSVDTALRSTESLRVKQVTMIDLGMDIEVSPVLV